MNTFEQDTGILGKAEFAHLKRTKEEFLEIAHNIRNRLGKQAYYLDKYLFDLFNAFSKTLAQEAASDGFDQTSELHFLCKEVLENNEKSKDHPLYPTVKAYIEDHPLSLQEKTTTVELYTAALAEEALEHFAPIYFDERKIVFREVMDIINERDLYRKICTIIGGEDDMEKMNLLIRQRFMVTTVMADFVQGFTNSLIYALSSRDSETNKSVIQLILEDMK